MLIEAVIVIVKVLVIFACLMTAIAYTTYFERKVVAHIQNRIGPNRVGPLGLLQPLADAIKLMFKEEIDPAGVNRFFYIRARSLLCCGLRFIRRYSCR